MNINDNHVIRFSNITVDLIGLRVWHGECEIHFTLTELRLLLAFLSEPYKTFSSDELIQRADLTSAGYLHAMISRLRLLLGQQYIFTRNRMGYTFVRPFCRTYKERKQHERAAA